MPLTPPPGATDPLPPKRVKPAPKSDLVPIIPVPDDAPPCRWKHPQHGEPDKLWPYHDADRRVAYYHARWNDDACAAVHRGQITYCRNGTGVARWAAKGPPKPYLLYNLPRLAETPDAPVLLVEGEKAADRAGAYLPNAWVVTTSFGGSSAAKHSDWSPLAGRDVVIWPRSEERRVGKEGR